MLKVNLVATWRLQCDDDTCAICRVSVYEPSLKGQAEDIIDKGTPPPTQPTPPKSTRPRTRDHSPSHTPAHETLLPRSIRAAAQSNHP